MRTMTVRNAKIDELTQDDRNANKGTERGRYMLDHSLRQYGAGRSILVDRNGKVIAGNKTLEAAADIGLDDVVVVQTDGSQLVAVQRTDLDLDDGDRARLMAYADNRSSEVGLEWDANEVKIDLDTGIDLTGLFRQEELSDILNMASQEEEASHIGREGRLYNAGDGHDIEPFKLAYRIEAAWCASGGMALDLFSGLGQLAAWYKRRFKQVITVDRDMAVGDVDYSMSASQFIQRHLSKFLDFDFVDFDDEGCPAREIQELFAAIAGKKKESFVLALTDGNGMNLKFRGRCNFGALYLSDESGMRRATRADYELFDQTVTAFISRCSERNGFNAESLSSYRGREGNVVYQTWLIHPSTQPDLA